MTSQGKRGHLPGALVFPGWYLLKRKESSRHAAQAPIGEARPLAENIFRPDRETKNAESFSKAVSQRDRLHDLT
jgi:hypothetical protein